MTPERAAEILIDCAGLAPEHVVEGVKYLYEKYGSSEPVAEAVGRSRAWVLLRLREAS